MADNVPVTAGSGTNIAADDIGSVFYQRVKLALGADGTAVDAVAGAGAVGTGVQRVTLASDDPAVVALQIMDDWDNAASDGCSVSGDVAHDAADAGEPVKIGARAIAALSGATLVSAADRTNLYGDLDGALIVRMDGCLGDDVNGNASNTDGANTQCIAAAGAGIRTYLTDFTITNTSSSNIFVEIKDGSTTRWTVPVPANGGVTHAFRTPLAGTANTAWNFDPSAATTTVYCSMSGFRSKL